ncbi:SEC-C metal-binding domain-containing protein [Aeromonas veronii]|uniref:SEC-C metal-binding domain-containing protein n=1 Tax=Aeromonas enteropelogenes TaxID=29489 RepID=UPI001600F80F
MGSVCCSYPACHFLAQRSERPAHSQPVVASTKIVRNELCPCDSGEKYKQCCLH